MIVLRRFLRDRRRSATWWVLSVVGLVAFTVAFWPTVRGQASFDDAVAQLPDAMRAMFGIDQAVSLGTAPGYLHGRVFATLLPALLIVNAVGLGAAAIAGSEDDGTLELLLASPVRRGRVLLERGLAALVLALVPAAAALVSVAVLGPPVGLLDGVSLAGLVSATVGAAALACLFGAIAFAVGAATGRRSLATASAATLAVGTYLLQGLLAAARSPDSFRWLSPWHWYLGHNMLIEGPSATAVVLPVAGTALVLLALTPRFTRRDLRGP